MQRLWIMMLFGLFIAFTAGTSSASEGVDIERMTKEQLQNKLLSQDTVVVDVRTGRDWKSSEFKIKGAIRPGDDIVQWASAYDKDTVFILYCA